MKSESTAIYLVDTNVFVYAHADEAPVKSQVAREILREISSGGIGCVSTQVLNETFSRLARGVQDVRGIEGVAGIISEIMERWRVLDTTSETVKEAMKGVTDYRMSYWDSLIWAAANLNCVPYVLSEDFSDGRRIEGVTFLNPFADGFALA